MLNVILILNREEKRVKISDIENIQTSPKQQSNIQIQIHLLEEEKEFLVSIFISSFMQHKIYSNLIRY